MFLWFNPTKMGISGEPALKNLHEDFSQPEQRDLPGFQQ
jgi:hypothetical protein